MASKTGIRDVKGQLTIFIIVGVILVAGVVAFFIFRGGINFTSVPADLQPAYNNFLECIREGSSTGINVLESQAGYIELPNFVPGSNYMPFSSQLDFLGNPVPYWYYVSGNNIQEEQVPTKSDMGKQLGKFVQERINSCKFDSFYEEGIEVDMDVKNPKASVSINDKTVDINLEMSLTLTKGEETVKIDSHKVSVDSSLGKLYDNAKNIYSQEQKSLFLEDYAIDNLRLYAPVDGVEVTCAPKVWNANEVFKNLQNAVEANTQALKVKGDDYTLLNKDNKYFIIKDLQVDSDVSVRFLNSKNWTYNYEVEPSDSGILLATPVGNQPGLGILGFCYVPYHFVYNMGYPVMIQVSAKNSNEIFQFPMAVVIRANNPRNSLNATAVDLGLPELCNYNNTLTRVKVYDTNLNPVSNVDVSYECFSTKCEIGKTSSNGVVEAGFPQCVNGFIITHSEGFRDSRNIYTSTNTGNSEIIIDRSYKVGVDLEIDNKPYTGSAIITFSLDNSSTTISYPEQKEVDLSEGQYEIQVSIYRSSSLTIPKTTQQQCTEVPRSGLGGLLGLTKEKCFDIEFPEQAITNVLAGGGTQQYYILESELKDSKTIEINAQGLPVPSSIEQLQENYLLFEDKHLDIVFK